MARHCYRPDLPSPFPSLLLQCVGDILLQRPSLHGSLSGFASLLNLLSSRGFQVAPSKAQVSSFQVTYLDSLSDQLTLSQCVLEHTLSRSTPHRAIHDVSHQCPPLQQFLSQVTLQLPVPKLPLITAVPSRTRSPRETRNRFSQPLHLSLKNLLQMNSLNTNLPNNPCSKKSQL